MYLPNLDIHVKCRGNCKPEEEAQQCDGGPQADDNNNDHVGSPLPGQVAKVFVEAGNKVIKGDKLLVIEAMKMETTINAEKSGTIKLVNISSGDNVETKDLLVEIN